MRSRQAGSVSAACSPDSSGGSRADAQKNDVILKNGGTYGDGKGNDPQCQAKAVDGYRVYPPHSYRAYFTRVPDLYGCSTKLQTLRVSAVAPASRYSDFKPKF